MRAATYMKSSHATTDPELMELKDETFSRGRQLMRDEFGRYQNKGIYYIALDLSSIIICRALGRIGSV